ncbi:MAG: phosphoglycerate kinase [Christensenellales bacterium]|jgi:phosphoglycerate kinase
MKHGIRTIDDFDLNSKTVLLRVDINEPVDKKNNSLKDITRIEGCIPTIRELAEKQAKVVILAHQGSDIEYQNYYDLSLHADVIRELLNRPVEFVPDVCGPYAVERIKAMKPGDIVLLDNVRFMAEEMTLFETKLNLTPQQQAQTQVVKRLAPLADLYVCDAFAATHRAQPTLVGFEQVLPSAMGRLFEKEYTIISDILKSPERPCIFVLGGAKIEDAFLMMDKVLKEETADAVLTGGLVANVVAVAKDIDIGKASEDFIYKKNFGDCIERAREILDAYSDKIVVPEDFAYVEDGVRHEVSVGEIPQDKLLIDIGHKTIDRYVNIIHQAGTVFMNGPMGVFEKELSDLGTKAVWEAAANTKGFSVIGGGDSIAAANLFGVSERLGYVCTGGGALVRFLSGEELPVVKALKDAAK